MEYRCIATSVAGFVQQLVSCYLPHGYWFYVSGIVPKEKDPRTVDLKLLERYGIGISRQSRARRKAVGIANVHYIRYQRRFLLLATHGHHPFFDDEAQNIRDARHVAIRFAGLFDLGCSWRVQSQEFNERGLGPGHQMAGPGPDREGMVLRAESVPVDVALYRSAGGLAAELHNLPFEPYAPVRRQLLKLIRHINERRKPAGLEPIGFDVLRYGGGS